MIGVHFCIVMGVLGYWVSGTLSIGVFSFVPFWLWDLRVFLLLGSPHLFTSSLASWFSRLSLFLVTQYLDSFDMPTVLSVLFSA